MFGLIKTMCVVNNFMGHNKVNLAKTLKGFRAVVISSLCSQHALLNTLWAWNKNNNKNNNVTAPPTESALSLPDTFHCFRWEFVQTSNYFLYFPSSAKADAWKRSYRCRYRYSKCQWMLLSYDARTSNIYSCCLLGQMAGWWDTHCHQADVGLMPQWTRTDLQNENDDIQTHSPGEGTCTIPVALCPNPD